MNEKQIIKNSKLLAKFLSWEKANDLEYETPFIQTITDKYSGIEKTCNFSLSEMEFHKSWDWLMSVVEKMEDLTLPIKNTQEVLAFSVLIQDDYCTIIWSNEETNYGFEDIDEVAPTKIEAVYKAAVKFIKWYNKLKL